MKKIFCFINGTNVIGYTVCSLSEDGESLAGHLSSSESYAKYDIGITSERKHDLYKAKYPEGYELVWVDGRDELPEDFKKAIEIANSKPEEA